MKKMTRSWCLESRKLLVWYKDRVGLLSKRIENLQLEKESYEGMISFVEQLCPEQEAKI